VTAFLQLSRGTTPWLPACAQPVRSACTRLRRSALSGERQRAMMCAVPVHPPAGQCLNRRAAARHEVHEHVRHVLERLRSAAVQGREPALPGHHAPAGQPAGGAGRA